MAKFTLTILTVCLASLATLSTRATSVLSLTMDEHLMQSCAVFRGTVLAVDCFKSPDDGHIYTRTLLQVDEAFKGTLPAVVKVIHRGGTYGTEGEMDGFAPQFKAGEERLLFLSRRADRTLYAPLGGLSAMKLQRAKASNAAVRPTSAPFIPRHQSLLEEIRAKTQQKGEAGNDVTDQSAALPAQSERAASGAGPSAMFGVTGLLVDGSGISARFILPDRGEPIPYLVDADFLPNGITTNQALQAVETALATWKAVTSLKYTFDGIQSFGMAAANVATNDGKLRIQLHDHYGYITGSNTLAIGGRGHYPLITAGWATGGNVAGNEFHQTTRGYVVLQHTNMAMQNLTTFTEVICHEVGHSLSLAHSSEDPNETNSVLKEAIMYARAHADGRGATLGSYDPPIVRQVHPPTNTPPYTYSRVMDIVTDDPNPPNVPGINEIELRGYDLQTTNLILATTNGTSASGTFSRMGNVLKFTPGYFSAPRIDPATTSFYDRIVARYSDGTNSSPFVMIRVISLSPDTEPSPAGDGIPDNWMITYFGDPDPTAGPNRSANADFDGDSLSNKQEFLVGSDPTDTNSNLTITAFGLNAVQWQAKAYELYEVQRSTNLSIWTRAINPIVPVTSAGTATGFSDSFAAYEFIRILKVP